MTTMYKDIFMEGPICPAFLSKAVGNHQTKTKIGAHNLFLGQVRADTIDGRNVRAITYTAQSEMANQIAHTIREEAFSRFSLSCMHIYHSLGIVGVGEISFFIFVSGPRRKDVFRALPYLVDEVKAKLPIFGKEIFDDGTHHWKKND